MADTSRDIRILAVGRLVDRLRESVQRRQFGSRKQTGGAESLLDDLASKVATLRYCYMEDADLASFDTTLEAAETARRVAALLADQPGITDERSAFLGFFAAVVGDLPAAFCRTATLEALTPVAVGRVVTADKAPKTKNLLLCRVEVFGTTMQIVTNLVKTRAGDLMKVARVPPAEVMGILSDAQFVGSAEPGSEPGSRPALDEHEAQEIRRAMGGLLDA